MREADSDEQRRDSLQRIVEYCLAAHDIPCAQKHAVAIAELNQALAAHEPSYMQVWRQIEASTSLLRALIYSQEEATQRLASSLQKLLETTHGAEGVVAYMKANQALALWEIRRGRKSASMAHLDRAWTHFLSGTAWGVLELVQNANEFSVLLAATGQAKRAKAVNRIVLPLVMKYGKAVPYEAFTHLVLHSDVLARDGDVDGAVRVTNLASSLLNGLDFPDEVKKYFQRQLQISLLIGCSLRVGSECSTTEFHYGDLSTYLESSSARVNSDSLPAAIAVAMYDLGKGRRPPPGALSALIGGRLDNELEEAGTISKAAVTAFASALAAFAAHDEAGAAMRMREAVSAELSSIRDRRMASPFGLLQLSHHQRLVLTLGAALLGSEEGDQSLLFEISDLASRSSRNVEADYMDLHSRASRNSDRNALQSYHRLRQDVELLEQRILRARVEYRLKEPTATPDQTVDSSVLIRMNSVSRELANFEGLLADILKSIDMRSSGLRELRSALTDGEIYINFVVTGPRVIVQCTSPKAVISGVGNLGDLQPADLKLLSASLTNPSPPNDEVDTSFPLGAANRLSKVLVQPVMECVRGARRIYFNNDESFAAISLLALLNPDKLLPKDAPLTTVPWLASTHEIVTVASATQLVAARRLGVSNSTGAFLGIGAPVLSGQTSDGVQRGRAVLRGAAAATGLSELGELPETRAELSTLGRTFGESSQLLLGERATEVSLRRHALRDFNVISFATHGLIREEVPGLLEPALVLTPQNTDSPLDDGLLTATEISRLDLDASLVILSACNSARIDLGLFSPEAASLSTAFFLAGTRSTLASLWSVNSEAAVNLMLDFGREFGAGNIAAATAHHRAIRKFLSGQYGVRFAHPRYWAAFMLYGDGGTTTAVAPAYLRSVSAFLEREGHIQQSSATDDAIIVAGADKVAAELYSGYIRRLTSDGSTRWTFGSGDRFYAISKDAETSGSIFAVSYPREFDKTLPFEVLEINAATGRLKRRAVIGRAAGEINGRPVLSRGGQNLLFTTHLVASDSSPATLVSFDLAAWKVTRRLVIDSSPNVYQRRLRLSRGLQDNLVLIVQGTTRTQDSRPKLSRLGTIETCDMETQAEVIELNSRSSELGPRRLYRGLMLSEPAVVDGAKLIFPFSLHDCGGMRTLQHGVAALESDGSLRPILIDLGGYQGFAGKLIRLRDGGFLLFGQVSRSFEDSTTITREYAIKARAYDAIDRESALRQTGVYFVRLSSDLAIERSEVLFSGLDVFVEDYVQRASEVQFFGSSADRMFSAIVKTSRK